MLTPDQARIADDAIARVRAARDEAQAAIDGEWAILTWATGSESASAARQEDLRQTQKILDQLEAKRPGLEAGGLVGFVQLAAAGAEVSGLLEGARRVTGSGFVAEVVAPTLSDLNPLNPLGAIGKYLIPVAVVAVVVYLAARRA